jgi:hypothetical protein
MEGKRTRHVARLCTPNVQVQRDVGDVHEQVSWQKEPGNQHMHVLLHRIVTLKNGVNQKADHLHCCDAAETACPLPRSSAFFLTSQHDPRALLPPHCTGESNPSILHWSAHCARGACRRNAHQDACMGVGRQTLLTKPSKGRGAGKAFYCRGLLRKQVR